MRTVSEIIAGPFAGIRSWSLAPSLSAADSDGALVAAAVRSGGRSAFEHLVRRHTPPLRRYIARLTNDSPDTDDLVQEAFIRAWTQLKSFDAQRGAFSTWLHRIAHNIAIDLLRQRRRERPLEAAAETPAKEIDPELAQMRRAISDLGPNQRAVVILRHLQGFSQKEAAAILELSEDAVESLSARAKRALRDAMGTN